MNTERIILGIDPGTTIMGYGVIRVCDQHSWARGVEIKHLLIAKWLDGRLHFYHASGVGLGLADMDAYTYMKDKFTMIGVAVYRFKDHDAA